MTDYCYLKEQMLNKIITFHGIVCGFENQIHKVF